MVNTFFGLIVSSESSSHFQMNCCGSRAKAFNISLTLSLGRDDALILPPQLMNTTPSLALSINFCNF